MFAVPLGVGAHLESWDVPAEQIIELDWWEGAAVGSLALIATPARHFSGRRLTDVNRTLWASWTMIGPESRVFYSGDTGWHDQFEKIGNDYGPFDLTIIKCGAYDDAWPDIHLNGIQAVEANVALKGRQMLPVHWLHLRSGPPRLGRTDPAGGRDCLGNGSRCDHAQGGGDRRSGQPARVAHLVGRASVSDGSKTARGIVQPRLLHHNTFYEFVFGRFRESGGLGDSRHAAYERCDASGFSSSSAKTP